MAAGGAEGQRMAQAQAQARQPKREAQQAGISSSVVIARLMSYDVVSCACACHFLLAAIHDALLGWQRFFGSHVCSGFVWLFVIFV